MNLDEILTTKQLIGKEFTTDVLADYILILSALSIKLDRLANNKSLPSAYRVNFKEDVDSLNSVLNDLKKFN